MQTTGSMSYAMMGNEYCCVNCRWWAFPECVCANVNSTNFADYMLGVEKCPKFEGLSCDNNKDTI